MTINNAIDLFRSIATAHYQIKGFGFGNMFEINGEIKKVNYPVFWVVPLSSSPLINTRERRYFITIASLVKHDESNRDDVWSDMEQIFCDVIKILREESDLYELKNDPVMLPISEKFSDWVTGWQGEIVIETNLNNNYCDIPADGLNTPVSIPGFAIIKDQYGNTVTTLLPGEVYTIEILDTIRQQLGGVIPTIIQVLQ